jgi:hypothetical protein
MSIFDFLFFCKLCAREGYFLGVLPSRAAYCYAGMNDSSVKQPQDIEVDAPSSGYEPGLDLGLGGELRLDVLQMRLPAELPVKYQPQDMCLQAWLKRRQR